MNLTKYKDFLVIIAVYALAYFSILLNDGFFWDGWVISNSSPEQLIQIFKDNGNYWYGYFFALIKNMGGLIFLSRLITFLSYLVIGLIFYQVIKKYTFALSNFALIITLYFVTFPVNFARITVMNTPYAICLLLFAVSYYIFLKNDKNFFKIFLASIFLFLSLFMASLLFLVPVLLVHKFFYYRYKYDFKNIINFLMSNKMLVIIPIVYVVVKFIFLEPSGIYQDGNYNQITLNRVILLPLRFIEGLYYSLVLPTNLSINYAASNLVIVLLFLGFLSKLNILSGDVLTKKSLEAINFKKLLFASFLLLFLGMFAYLLVGKTPSLLTWNSRHQILLPIGISIFLFNIMAYGLTRFESINFSKLFALLPIAIFITFNINIYFSYIIDWYKQISFIEHVVENDDLMNSSTFIIKDNTIDLNALDRSKSFIDYTGILKKTLNKEDKLVDENSLLDLNEYLKYKQDGVYAISDWEPGLPDYVVYLNYGSFEVNNVSLIKLLINRIIDPNKNLINTKKILDIEIKKIGNDNE